MYQVWRINGGSMTKFYSNVIVNEHFVPQVEFSGIRFGMSYDRILKGELMNEWYDSLVEDLGLVELMDTGWGEDRTGCFFSTEAHPCDGPSGLVDEFGALE